MNLNWTPELLEPALAHLRGAPERVAFALTDGRENPMVIDTMLMNDEDLEPGELCAILTDTARSRVLRWAASTPGWLIEAHSHIGPWGDPAQFSSIDLAGFDEWVPHVRWRLGWRPYVALVVGPSTFDGLIWADGKHPEPEQITAMSILGDTTVEATCRTLMHMEVHR